MESAKHHSLMVCDHCDAVYRKPRFRRGRLARCTRCGAVLERMQRLDVGGMLALTFAGLIVFAIANAYPLVRIDVRGAEDANTLWGTIVTSWHAGAFGVAVLTLFTLFVFPLAELLAALYVLWPLALGRRTPGFGTGMRVLRLAREWSMPEVFMLGVIVAVVKLGSLAKIAPGAGLWAFAALTVLLTLVTSFDHGCLWDLATERRS
ncbi:MAG TPA: paraquat-inducible protein A [Rudaea sp.]|nr:paraquat-inducible protein A [Rudaea sp.]